MTPVELANRFSTYADAISAFAVVNAFAFIAAFAEEDIRDSVEFDYHFVLGLVFSGLVYSAAIVILRRGELRLRKEGGEDISPLVARYGVYVQVARLALVWLASLVALLLGASIAN